MSAPYRLTRALEDLRVGVDHRAPDALRAVTDLRCQPGRQSHRAVGVLNFRIPPGADLAACRAAAVAQAGPGVEIDELRATPGVSGGRTTPLVKAFTRAFREAGIPPRYVVKKGTSDMNTLATTWRGVPMVAYGPGDSALDHTHVERLGAAEYRTARGILTDAVTTWFGLTERSRA